MRAFLLLLALFAFMRVGAFGAEGPGFKPNIVLILADDLGWSDLGCYGADLHETPNIDQLANEGMRFTDAYAMSVCSPTRAMLMTGKHAARVHITIWAEGSLQGPKNRKLLQAASEHNLALEEKTIASHLQGIGYLTALVGKWHLGDADHFPEAHGFDVNIGGTHWGAPQTFFWPYSGTGRFGPEFRYVPHLEFGKPGEYLTDRLTDEAIRVIDHADGKPFFLYLAHHAVHTPMEAKPEYIAYFEKKLNPGMNHQNAVYAAMTKSLDESVGRVRAHLKEKGLADNTIVIFASDNGGFTGIDRRAGQTVPVTNNAPLRSGKGALYEGGIRVPLIIHWPGIVTTKSECHEPVLLADLFHTLLPACGIAHPEGAAADGVDLMPLLKQPNKKLNRSALFFHYPHYYETTTPAGAMREGDWKLLEYFEDNHLELYNLQNDLSETKDFAAAMPERANQMRAKLHAWRESVNAAMPTVNPNPVGPKKAGKIKN